MLAVTVRCRTRASCRISPKCGVLGCYKSGAWGPFARMAEPTGVVTVEFPLVHNSGRRPHQHTVVLGRVQDRRTIVRGM